MNNAANEPTIYNFTMKRYQQTAFPTGSREIFEHIRCTWTLEALNDFQLALQKRSFSLPHTTALLYNRFGTGGECPMSVKTAQQYWGGQFAGAEFTVEKLNLDNGWAIWFLFGFFAEAPPWKANEERCPRCNEGWVEKPTLSNVTPACWFCKTETEEAISKVGA